jgi:tRNA (adenine57-N1/adenine58-N1)-methyltransferase
MTDTIMAGDWVYFGIDPKRRWIRRVVAGQKFQCDRGDIAFDQVIGQTYGTCVVTEQRRAKVFLLKPTPYDLIMKMRRSSQIIYPEDIGAIIMHAGIAPGLKVVEAGVGSGAVTAIMAMIVGPRGHVHSYDLRPEALEQSRKNVALFDVQGQCTIEYGDICGGVQQSDADVVMLDIPNPWDAIPHVTSFLKPAGRLVSFSAVMEQVIKTLDLLRTLPYIDVFTFELLKRDYQNKPNATRPQIDMVGHTGYITVARRIEDTVGEITGIRPATDEFVEMLI